MFSKLFASSVALMCFYALPIYAEEAPKTVKPAKNENTERGRFRHWIRSMLYGYDPYYYDPYYYDPYYYDPYYSIYGYGPYDYRHRFYYGYPRRPRPHIWTTGMGYNDY